jgi:hypothetical protein
MTPSQQFECLLGRHISSWIGIELAADTDEPVVWADMSSGCLQFLDLEAHATSHEHFRWTARLDDNGDYFGLYFDQDASPLEVFEAHGSDFLRCRFAPEIPTGRIEWVETTIDEYGQTVSVTLTIAGTKVTISCGEIIWNRGEMKVERPQEFVLVEVSDQQSRDRRFE